MDTTEYPRFIADITSITVYNQTIDIRESRKFITKTYSFLQLLKKVKHLGQFDYISHLTVHHPSWSRPGLQPLRGAPGRVWLSRAHHREVHEEHQGRGQVVCGEPARDRAMAG